jgi:anti-sigma factor RsiW
MKCAQIHPNLAAFVVGGLEPKEAAEVRGHLASCPGCRHELEELRKVNRALEAAPPPADPPAYLKDEILSLVRAEGLSPSNKEEPEESSSLEEQRVSRLATGGLYRMLDADFGEGPF